MYRYTDGNRGGYAMSARYRLSSLAVFLLRTAVLLFLLFNLYGYLQDILDLPFVFCAFALVMLVAFGLERLGVRILLGAALLVGIPFALRIGFFLFFRILQGNALSEADFLFHSFDKNFFPLLVPLFAAGMFTFLAARYKAFLFAEVGLNAVVLALVFSSQSHYRITLYPHPSILACAVFLFVFAEIVILILGQKRAINVETVGSTGKRGRSFFVFLLTAIPLIAVLIVFMLGRYSQGAASSRGGLITPTMFRFDFSKYVRLESEISMNNDLVLVFRKEGPAERMLLRRFVLSGYRPDSGFFYDSKTDADGSDITVPDAPLTVRDPGYASRSEIDQEFFFVNFDPSSLVAMNYPVRITPMKNWDDSSFLRIYRATSKISSAEPFDLLETEAPAMDQALYKYYTDYGGDERVRALALEITNDVPFYYEKIVAVMEYLKTGYYYSLKPGIAEDGNQLHHFLFKSKKGYCSYFAFSMALLLRSVGIPARVSVGFFVDPNLEVLNFYPVHADMAHAWVEVFFGDYGWIEFDPTAERLAPGEQLHFDASVNVEKLASLIEEILNNQDSLEAEQTTAQERPESGMQAFVRSMRILVRFWYLIVPALYAAFLAIAKTKYRLLFSLSGSSRKKVKHLFRAALLSVYGYGLARKPDESLLEYCSRIERDERIRLNCLADRYLKAVFGNEFSDSDFSEAKEKYLQYKRSERERFPLVLRILAFMNPRGAFRRFP